MSVAIAYGEQMGAELKSASYNPVSLASIYYTND